MRLRLILLIVLLLGLVGCDHATKAWAEQSLPTAQRELLPGVLDLNYTQNDDSAFSTLRWLPVPVRWPLLVGTQSVASTFIVVLWWRRRRAPVLEQGAYALVLAGALGNLIDRIARGYVVDFIHLHYWPVFNFADAFIVLGAAALFIAQLRRPARPPPADRPDAAPS